MQHVEELEGAPAGPSGLSLHAVGAGVGAAVAALVVFPLTRRGWLLLLDWAPGPHEALAPLSRSLDRGVPASAFLDFLMAALRAAFGAATAGWLALAIALALGVYAAGHLVGGPAPHRVAAGVAFVVNPVTYERAYAGQFGFLLAAAVVPLVAGELLRCRKDRGRWIHAALWTTLAVGFTPHAAWIIATVVLGVALTSPTLQAVRSLGTFSVATLVLNMYLIVPALTAPAQVAIGQGDVHAFATRSDPRLGLVGNVAALYGFWRGSPNLAKDQIPGWPFFFVAFIAVVTAGCLYSRRRPDVRGMLLPLGVAGVISLALACGTRGPAAAIFDTLFENVPGFEIMREPQKFVVGLALFYAVAFAAGVEAMARKVTANWRTAVGLSIAVLVPVACTPTLFGALLGQVRVSRVPASWEAADRAVGIGEGKILFLPWHQYMSFPFTGRVVANPAAAFFRRPVISSDDAELRGLAGTVSGQSEYLEHFYARGARLCAFGDLLAPLGVEFVVVAKAVDWRRYDWLGSQVDLMKVSESADLVVYRNQRYRGIAWVAPEREVRDWQEVESLSREGGVSTHGLAVEQPGSPPVVEPATTGCAPVGAAPGVAAATRESPTAYQLPRGAKGRAVLAEQFDPSWGGAGHTAVPLVADRVGIPTDGRGEQVHLRRARTNTLAWAASLSAALLFVLWLSTRRLRSGVEWRRRAGGQGRGW